MNRSLSAIKPSIAVPLTHVSPGSVTMGEVLSRTVFTHLYKVADEEGARCFPLMDREGDVELYILFDTIDQFGEQADADVYLEFHQHKNDWIAVFWTVMSPNDPLGYPIAFHTLNDEQRYLAVRFLEQKQVWIHYLAFAGEDLVHIFSEAIDFAAEDKARAENLLLNAYYYKEESQAEQGEMPQETISGQTLDRGMLLTSGVSFYLDYAALEKQYGEEGAKESVMGAIYRALWMMSRHPKSQARDASFLVWVGQVEGENRNGRMTRLLSVTITPSLRGMMKGVHVSEDEENPLASLLMSLAEFLKTEEEQPFAAGYLPIIGYRSGTLQHIEWDDASVLRLKRLFVDSFPNAVLNPYSG
ncbi:hypothetical protein PP175_08440 [Aneurinibacillus sp. Ricciae_BoGa-3]|uniref:hypothetical protein n=1 Tax=Aneurinibacillus sp. Ricciae_BoGa-3 TaxID=3022697 RepID=UPI0023412A0B|nr:hypothetical protein [Aneurinibacillus sp. Ricciae_BoGa-3]WCK55930.1 hypothetical protein PP175_08440 [Aneurinibacillus sp. Ricciae_BoGa-3]